MSYTINPNAKNKWARNAENTMNLSIETDASSVYLDNGRTLEQELGEGSMVSNVATIDSAMSKVVDGTLDGAYESCVLKGRTLVNSIGTLGNFRKYSDIYFYCDTKGLIKPSAKYYYQIKNLPSNCRFCIGNSKSSTETFFSYQAYSLQGTVTTKTTQPDESVRVWIYRVDDTTNDLVEVLNEIELVFIEYQEGMENWGISFFEGICDVKMPILRNVGKNLIDGTGGYIGLQGPDGATATNVLTGDGSLKRYSYIVKCKPKTAYTLTTRGTANRCSLGEFVEYPRSGVRGTKRGNLNTNGTLTITTQADTQYLVCYSYYRETAHTQSEMDEIVRGLKVQLEESPTQTTYEDYKTNILRTPEIVTLRSLPNGVRDELNLKTGEYIKRIGEVVLNGTENNWGTAFNYNGTNDYSTFKLDTALPNGKTVTYPLDAYIVDKMQNGHSLNELREFVHINSQPRVCIKLLKTRLSEQTVTGLKAWLQQNPITIQYELAEPNTTIVEPLTIPFAYQNGHVILESGHEGQSLLPTLKYSTVVNKTGQIESVAKVIQTQEKQLTMLEQMLIQNIINLDYNNTLLTLKNEMEEML